MALDPRIAMMGQPIQLNSPLNMLARAQGVQNMQQTNALNAMHMEDARTQRAAQQQAAQARAQALASLPPPPADAPAELHVAHKAVTSGLMQPKDYLDLVLKPKPDRKLTVVGKTAIDTNTGQSVYSEPPTPEKPDPNKPFSIVDGQIVPNMPFQNYQRSLKDKPAPAGGAVAAPDGGEDQSALTRRFGKAGAGYRWRDDGSQEAIPGGPADQKAQAKSAGEGTVDNVAAALRVHYDNLDKSGGITNPDKSAFANFPAAISSSEVGQVAGRMFGTQNQSARNSISMTRPMLMQAIMKATGMSAKQMDSNAELKLWIATATDPTLDVRANREALDRIESLYGSGASANKQTGGASGGWSIKKAP